MADTRRRGEALENAILEAAWLGLIDSGYLGMTYERVAERAQTGKQVLYRRWPSKQELLVALLAHRGVMSPTAVLPVTGSLRGDAIALLTGANWLADSIAGLFSSMIGAYFDETNLSPAQLRAMVFGDRPSGMERLVARAVERGELEAGAVPQRVITMPFDLMRGELIMSFAPVSEAKIVEIVDTLFLPLVRLATEPRTG